MENTLFENWESLMGVLIVSILVYASMIAMLRISGKRTLSQMKEFDFIISVALGSTLSAVILDKTISLAEGVLTIAILILLQMLIAKMSLRSEKFQNL